MATRIWRGDAQPRRQVTEISPASVAINDVYKLTINGKDITFTATVASTAGITEVCNGLKALIDDQTDGTATILLYEFSELEASVSGSPVSKLILTGPVDGKPFTVTAAVTGTGTCGNSTTTTPTGPNWFSDAENWSGGSAPTTGDVVVFEQSDVDCLYGMDSISDTLAELRIKSSYTGRIGLPRWTGNYREYRTTALTIPATLVAVGEGSGSGSKFVRLNLGSVATAITVYNTGQPDDDMPAFIWKGTHANNDCFVYRGSVGIGLEKHGDSYKVRTLKVGYLDSRESDATVAVGTGCPQMPTITQTGGALELNLPSGITVTTFERLGGEATFGGEAAVTDLINQEGTLYYTSSGTATVVVISQGATIACTRDLRGRTFTDCTMEAGASLLDPHQTLTLTNGVALANCSLQEVTLDLGTNVILSWVSA